MTIIFFFFFFVVLGAFVLSFSFCTGNLDTQLCVCVFRVWGGFVCMCFHPSPPRLFRERFLCAMCFFHGLVCYSVYKQLW